MTKLFEACKEHIELLQLTEFQKKEVLEMLSEYEDLLALAKNKIDQQNAIWINAFRKRVPVGSPSREMLDLEFQYLKAGVGNLPVD